MSGIYVTAAFKTNVTNEAYIFMKNEYLKLNYAPSCKDDFILYGPAKNSDIPSLKNTIFEDRVDCAFGSHNSGEAYIFAWNNCALWAYPSAYSTNDVKLVKGPMPIAEMFPFLKGTVFEHGVNAAFESSVKYEAYLFKDNKYARINYGPENPRLRAYHDVAPYWPAFKGTILENGGFDAALASHRENDAYIFKGDSYALLRYTPGDGSREGLRGGGVKKIKEHWNGLGSVLPRDESRILQELRRLDLKMIVCDECFPGYTI